MVLKTAIVGVIGFLIGCLSWLLFPDKTPSEKSYQQGVNLIKMGRALEAKGFFSSIALEGDPDAAVGYAFTEYYAGNHLTAINIASMVLKQDKIEDRTRARAHYVIGFVEHATANYQKSIDAMKQSREFYKSDSYAVYLCNFKIAQNYIAVNRVDDAIDLLLKLEPEEKSLGDYYFQLYKAYRLKGDLEKSKKFYSRALDLFSIFDQSRIDLLSTAGWFELLHGNKELGRELSERAIELQAKKSEQENILEISDEEKKLDAMQIDRTRKAYVECNRLLYLDCNSAEFEKVLDLCLGVSRTDARLRAYLKMALNRC